MFICNTLYTLAFKALIPKIYFEKGIWSSFLMVFYTTHSHILCVRAFFISTLCYCCCVTINFPYSSFASHILIYVLSFHFVSSTLPFFFLLRHHFYFCYKIPFKYLTNWKSYHLTCIHIQSTETQWIALKCCNVKSQTCMCLCIETEQDQKENRIKEWNQIDNGSSEKRGKENGAKKNQRSVSAPIYLLQIYFM